MVLEFSEHAKEQLKRRKIPQKLVIGAIKNPDKIIISFRGRMLRQKDINGKLLEVVTKTEGSKITVITAYYLEE